MKTVAGALALGLTLAAAPVLAAGFPVSLDNSFGTTIVAAQPRRVVSIGYVEQDFLYALGIAPVAVRNWWGDHPYATWPWAEAARQAVGAEPAVFNGDELNLEWVLDQNPDLIVGTFIEMDQAQYDALSRIAPVVALPKGYPTWGAPWQDELRAIDLATSGSTEKSDRIVADIEARFARVKADYPQFAGRTATNVYYDDGVFHLYDEEDSASRFLVSLGLSFPPEFRGQGDEESNRITVSPENLRTLDLDAVVWPIDAGSDTQKLVEAMPLYRNLRLAREGRSVWLDDGQGTMSGALSFQTPLSIAWLLDKLPPMLAAALDGDPATK